jgi:hypothetical protein
MFQKIAETQFPRLLTQVCRDPNAPFHGCFDRNWWHYRIRDFASVMLQQGGYTLAQYAKLDAFRSFQPGLEAIARAAAQFWNKRATRRGAFEEYYPWERGYPPLAFSTLAMAKLVYEGVVDADDILPGLRKAVKQLQQRFESQAGNQQVAGLAALGVIRKVRPDLVKEEKYTALKKRTLALQHSEGWYAEYDGPDLGYLSVTLDCLWDLFDVTQDKDYLESASRALGFMHGFIVRRHGGAGMHNARNTDYIVPYGICRFLEHEGSAQEQEAREILHLVYHDLENPRHFFHAIDDRYWSHYIGHSVVRAQLLLHDKRIQKAKELQPGMPFTFEGAGVMFRELKNKKRLIVSGRKGGVFSVYDESRTLISDFGWVIRSGNRQYVNHWWSEAWKWEATGDTIEIEGMMFPHREKISKPILHFGLRVVSFLFGSVLTKLLRNVLIFKSGTSGITFSRKIVVGPEDLTITDQVRGIDKKARVDRAPRASKRHVASADSWHPEDFGLRNVDEPMETIIREGSKITITTIYSCA